MFGKKLLTLFEILLTATLFLIFQESAFADTDCTDTVTTGVPQTECEALVALYTGTTGGSWTDNTNWNTDTAVSTWYGITVSGGHVTQIVMTTANNLVGSLPDEIGDLTSLTKIDVRGNTGLTGSIPSTVGSLTSLTTLNLSSNRLSGSIPSGIGNLTNLLVLYLNNNYNMSGEIPSSITNLTSLLTIYLSYNQFSGSIPEGLPSTLIFLSLKNNNFSGDIPSDIKNISLTQFYIENNDFVFSDFETDFDTFVSEYGAGFTYDPQNTVDTERTITATEGDTLTITPSVEANANDQYQWYKDSTAIDGATSRIYTKTAEATDTGTYTYEITNSTISALTLDSNDITVNIPPNPPSSDSIYYLLDGDDVWVRGSISTTKDIAEQFTFDSTMNQNITFEQTYLIDSTTPNHVGSYTSGTRVSNNQGQDNTPINTVNAGYVAEGHGLLTPVVTSAGHDKTDVDIGSEWSDGTYTWILAEISGDDITFFSETAGSPWRMITTVADTLTHTSGATHTNDITIDSQTTTQQYPIVTNITRQALANGTTRVTDGDQGFANYIELVYEYDLVDPSTIVTTNNPFEWDDATGVWMHATTTFRVYPGTTIIHSAYEIQREINLGYFGIVQIYALSNDYDHQYYYIPKTQSIDGYDFKNTQLLDSAPASTLYFNRAYVEQEDNPPNREIIFLKEDTDDNYDLALAFGYSPYGATAAANRNCLDYTSGCWFIHTTKKTYPVMIGGTGVIDDTTYDAWAYRQWVDTSIYDINKSAYWNEQNDHHLVYIDYHESVTDDVTEIPSEYEGYEISVIESENITLSQSTVVENSITLSTTGSEAYGFAVLELTEPDTSSTSTPTSTSLLPVLRYGGSSDSSADSSEEPAEESAEESTEEPTPKLITTITDIAGHWAETEISEMTGTGVITGNPDGSFNPDNDLNRAEATALLFRILGYIEPSAPEEQPFPDVPVNKWYAGYIDRMKSLEMIDGYGDGLFRPGQNINRAEFVKIAFEIYSLLTDATLQDKNTNIYEDLEDDWYTPYVTTATEMGFVHGFVCGESDESRCFGAKNNITRAESAVILYNMFYELL